MGEEIPAVAELESLQRMAGQSKTGAGMNSPEKHKWGKTILTAVLLIRIKKP